MSVQQDNPRFLLLNRSATLVHNNTIDDGSGARGGAYI